MAVNLWSNICSRYLLIHDTFLNTIPLVLEIPFYGFPAARSLTSFCACSAAAEKKPPSVTAIEVEQPDEPEPIGNCFIPTYRRYQDVFDVMLAIRFEHTHSYRHRETLGPVHCGLGGCQACRCYRDAKQVLHTTSCVQ